ncbi:YchJ family protein [Rhodococcoides kyotonense]|uniref:UPF0225 protein SAMN05421642_11185 n=1 Tax=Rhodococcoides kyotonense TaxID=398843 RepID=A0A239KUQ9_9NOCA|nr:YchJ family protein [Rhodococcus kyotonensis]SNT21398.1 SEC-C motif-containing protein [Rhodococcus kyotonensis]
MSRACPCLRGEPFDECCGPYLRGETTPPTAERLMRSRFTAFSVGDAEYLIRTWHPTTAPGDLTLDPMQRWYRLDIVDARSGGLLDDVGTVQFSAYYKHPEGNGVLRERSRFTRVDGAWVYLDGVVAG